MYIFIKSSHLIHEYIKQTFLWFCSGVIHECHSSNWVCFFSILKMITNKTDKHREQNQQQREKESVRRKIKIMARLRPQTDISKFIRNTLWNVLNWCHFKLFNISHLRFWFVCFFLLSMLKTAAIYRIYSGECQTLSASLHDAGAGISRAVSAWNKMPVL